ncbi:MAG: cyclic nucleotide-binding domain-containing protein [Acidobacteriota bacterium]
MTQSIIETTLAGRETRMSVRAGETLFHEGESPRGVYVLHSGTVKLFFEGRKGAKALREAQAGQMLGLSCLVTQRAHDCTATAAEPCEIAFIGRDDLMHALDGSPAVWFGVLHELSSEVNAAYDDLRLMVHR